MPLIPFIAEDFNRIVLHLETQYDHSIMERIDRATKAADRYRGDGRKIVDSCPGIARGRDGTIAADPTSASMQH